MKSKHLKRRFTVLEIVIVCLLGLALFLGIYFGAVYYPWATRMDTVERELASTEALLTAAQIRKAEYDMMKAENEKTAGEDRAVMPPYDQNRQQGVLNELFTGILSGTRDWRISYGGEPSLNADGVRVRNVSFSFTVDGESTAEGATVYGKTKSVLHALMSTGYRCSMSTLSLTPSPSDLENATSIGVSCSINFYELGN